MKLFRGHISLLLIALLALAGCAKESWSEMPSPVGDKTTVCLELATDGVKSSVFGDDSRVDDARIAIYDESGVLYEVLEVVDGQAKTELWCTETYWFYALANMPQVEIPATREEMLALRYRIDDADSLYARMPMMGAYGYEQDAAGLAYTVPSGGRPQYLNLSLVRLLSRVDISVTFKDLKGLQIRSIQLKQAASDMLIFSKNSKPTSVYDHDRASAADLEAVNSGKTISLYCLENAQGELRFGFNNNLNTRPHYKTLDVMNRYNLSNADECTYIEVEAVFAPDSDYEGKVLYRVLLGKNDTYDLNMLRNNVVSLKFELSDDRFDDPLDWKMNTDELIQGEISQRETIYVAQRGTLSFPDLTRNITMSLTESGPAQNENSILRISRSGNTLTYNGIGAGTSAVYVRGQDSNRRTHEYTVLITVLAPELAFEKDEIRLSLTGEPLPFSEVANYYKQDGSIYTDYNQALYDELLAIDYTLTGNIKDKLTLANEQIYIHSVFDPYNPDNVGALTAQPRSNAAASATTLLIKSYDPFPATKNLNIRIESNALCQGGEDEQFQMEIGEFADFTDTSTYHFVLGTPDNIQSQKATAWFENGKLNLLWKYATNADLYLPGAQETLSAYLINRWSGESWWSPSRWTAGFNVNVCVGGEVYYVGGSSSNPMSYSVRAAWGHKHDANSILEELGGNLVAADEDYHGFYATGIGTPLYSLDYGTGYPTDDSWYQNNVPLFSIVDIDAENYLNPTYVSVPYKVIEGEHNIVVWHYKHFYPSSNNWVGK
ncbi:MAG: DUF4906 domain-containing protein [Bacteroidales bacterium]|nr:DUF4906 domain-containing protein [Bacteroidales bacterium]